LAAPVDWHFFSKVDYCAWLQKDWQEPELPVPVDFFLPVPVAYIPASGAG
jgi:hypothetical protein